MDDLHGEEFPPNFVATQIVGNAGYTRQKIIQPTEWLARGGTSLCFPLPFVPHFGGQAMQMSERILLFCKLSASQKGIWLANVYHKCFDSCLIYSSVFRDHWRRAERFPST